ncbi:hypothetical protein FB451DRAFT_1186390 [Mycena latifolia]|nr:hypothetical protein FB451DRAFT_1186390 [Mycena latifolia]
MTSSRSEPNVPGPDRPPKRRRTSEAGLPPSIKNIFPTEAQIKAFESSLSSQSESLLDYADPMKWHTIAFPFLYTSLPHHRFRFHPALDMKKNVLYNTFEWMGREAFPQLAQAVMDLRTDGTASSAAFLHGTIGAGKSHLLAALAVWLRLQGKMVVYLPDCDDLVKSPRQYIAAALLCAFSGQGLDHLTKRAQIRCLDSDLALEQWCREQYGEGIRFYFLIDQLNALEDRPGGMVSDLWRERARSLLLNLYCDHICVRSSSANDKQGYELLGRGQKETIILFRHRMTDREIHSWVEHYAEKVPTLSPSDLSTFTEYVGGVFLYFTALLNHPGKPLSEAWVQVIEDPVLQTARRDVHQFASKILTSPDTAVHDNYVAGARAFITGTSTKSIRPDLIDHRYCYVDANSDQGRVTSGIVRAELFELLEKQDKFIALSENWLGPGLENSIECPPVLGFMIEKSVLATFLIQGAHGPGLVNWPPVDRYTLLRGQSLPFDLPQELKKTNGTRSMLVIPQASNFEDIDALFIKVDNVKKIVIVIAIQVTLAATHKDSATGFYSRWTAWTAFFPGYTIETEFLWVVEKSEPSLTIEKGSRTTRKRSHIHKPKHIQHFVTLAAIAPHVAESLSRAREKYEAKRAMENQLREEEESKE